MHRVTRTWRRPPFPFLFILFIKEDEYLFSKIVNGTRTWWRTNEQ